MFRMLSIMLENLFAFFELVIWGKFNISRVRGHEITSNIFSTSIDNGFTTQKHHIEVLRVQNDDGRTGQKMVQNSIEEILPIKMKVSYR